MRVQREENSRQGEGEEEVVRRRMGRRRQGVGEDEVERRRRRKCREEEEERVEEGQGKSCSKGMLGSLNLCEFLRLWGLPLLGATRGWALGMELFCRQ